MSLFSGETSSKPQVYGPAKDATKSYWNTLENVFEKGPDKFSYQGSMVTPFSDQTKGAFGGMSDLAAANSGGRGMSAALQDIMNGGGFSSGQRETLGDMRNLSRDDFFNRFKSGTGLTADQEAVASKYRGDMSSPFDINSNPAYSAVRQQALDASQQALSGMAAKAGRYGGGASQSILAREQSNLANRMDDAEYRNWQQRGDAAASNLAGLSQTGVGNQSNAINMQSGLQNNLFNAQQAGIKNMSDAYNAALQPLQTQRAVGAEYEDLFSRQKADEYRKFQEQNPVNWLNQFAPLVTGAPQGSVQTSTPSYLQTAATLALGGGGLLSGLFGGGGTPAGGTGVV